MADPQTPPSEGRERNGEPADSRFPTANQEQHGPAANGEQSRGDGSGEPKDDRFPTANQAEREDPRKEEQGREGDKPEAKKDEEGGDKKEEKPGDDKEKKKTRFRWTPAKIIGLIVVVALVAVVAAYYIMYATSHESTDDAYTTGFVHEISSRVTGNVIKLLIVDNEHVTRGQVLLQLDPRDYLVQVAKAQANYDNAKADFDRVEGLKNDIAISKQDYDQSRTNLEVAEANLADANNQLSYCTIISPADGYIGNRTVDVGNRVTVGGALMAVIQDVWVVANYKETQIAKMKKNQRVQIKIDAIPGHTFQGHIDSFSPGTGSTFALLPPDNATGNFTKIVQRIPVKILFEPDEIRDYGRRLAAGLSVETYVDLDPSVRPVGDQVNKAGQ